MSREEQLEKEIESLLDSNKWVFLKILDERNFSAVGWSCPCVIIRIYDINDGVEKNILIYRKSESSKEWLLS